MAFGYQSNAFQEQTPAALCLHFASSFSQRQIIHRIKLIGISGISSNYIYIHTHDLISKLLTTTINMGHFSIANGYYQRHPARATKHILRLGRRSMMAMSLLLWLVVEPPI
jgi:hypothetical protein